MESTSGRNPKEKGYSTPTSPRQEHNSKQPPTKRSTGMPLLKIHAGESIFSRSANNGWEKIGEISHNGNAKVRPSNTAISWSFLGEPKLDRSRKALKKDYYMWRCFPGLYYSRCTSRALLFGHARGLQCYHKSLSTMNVQDAKHTTRVVSRGPGESFTNR